jgi:hypothetical protein
MKPDKIYLSLSLVIIFTIVSWITSCSHKTDLTDLPEVCFKPDVLNIFTTNCAWSGCHDGNGESGWALDNYYDIRSTVVPGNPDASSSYQAITSTWGENKMPPDQPLSIDNRTIIRVWILQGAKPTDCTVTKVTNDGTLSEKKNNQSK